VADSTLARRLVTIPALLFATAILTVALPFIVPIALLLSLHPRLRGLARSAAFITCYLWCETLGVVTAAWLWTRHRAPKPTDARWPTFLDANYRLQCAWSTALERAARSLFSLEFDIQGTDALTGPGAIVMARHASMADTVIPMVFYAIPHSIRLRYVLKRELLLDPCLDIVGNRLPNCFIRRDADDAAPEIARVVALLDNLRPDEGVMIYPEGTRFSPERRARVLKRVAAHATADDFARMESWIDLLPPRLGGPLALLDHNPGRDLVFCAHTGFEGSTHFSNLLNGSWTGSLVRIRFWRISNHELPGTREDRRLFLFAQWDRMQETVASLKQQSREHGQGAVLS
jgi:1-acyl-sn-glycerol-3-phosphate acyltransferase